MLNDSHVVDIFIEQSAFYISQIFGYRRHLRALLSQLLEFFIDFFTAPLLLHALYRLVNLESGVSAKRPEPFFLVVAGHFISDVPASGMDDQVQRSLFIFVNFNKMITSAESSDAPPRSLQVDVTGAGQIGKRNAGSQFVLRLSDFPSRWNFISYQTIQPVKIQFCFRNARGFHAAADVDSYHSRHDFVGYGHGSADGAAETGMNIGHDADFAACERFLVAYSADLPCRRFFQLHAVADCGVMGSFDSNHVVILLRLKPLFL